VLIAEKGAQGQQKGAMSATQLISAQKSIDKV